MSAIDKPPFQSDREAGAALLIIAAILAIIAALAVGIRYYAGPTRQLAHEQGNAINLNHIKIALTVFVAKNYRLPCPADASQTSWTEDCATQESNAVVPWKTLGIQENEAIDPWGQRIAYHPTSALTTGTPFQLATPSDGLSLYDSYDTSGIPTGAPKSAAYVLIAAGPDGAGGWMTSGNRKAVAALPKAEAENSDGDTNFIKTGFDSGATYFDDFVVSDTSAGICQETRLCTPSQQTENFFNSSDNPDVFVSSNASYGKLVKAANGKAPQAGQDNVIHFSENPGSKDGKSLDSVPTHEAVCVWINQKLNFQSQSLKAYFTFNWWPGEESNTQYGFADGFTMTIVPWGTATASCGYDGSSLGYKDMSLKSVNRMAVEFDIYQYSQAGTPYDQTTHDPDRNHVSALFNNSLDHNAAPGSAAGWAGSCAANSTNGSAGGCTYNTGGGIWRAWMEEKTRLEPKVVPIGTRLELQRGCDATCTSCASGGNFVQVRGWIDCTDDACKTLTGTTPRAALDAATARTLNYCVQQPANWGGEMNEVMLGFTYATGGATSALSIRDITIGNGKVQ